MSLDRQDKALREFKQIMADLVLLLRSSTNVELAYMCWVNHDRKQFVWETNSTELPNVMFQDRIAFDHHFLNDYKDITEIKQLTIGEDIPKGKLAHYLNYVKASSMVLVPFINKGETVAITVLESEFTIDVRAINKQLYAYNNAMVNVLDTYLEIVDLHEDQQEWEEYDAALQHIDYHLHRVALLNRMLNEMQQLVPTAVVHLLVPGMNSWCQVLSTGHRQNKPVIGMLMEQHSASFEAVEKGVPVFNMHFNNNPRIVCRQEGLIEGASLCIPILIHDRRQGVVVVHDADPLTFKESTKHKLTNLVRVTALSIQSVVKKVGMGDELLVEDFGAFMPDLWEESLNKVLQYSGSGVHTWFGLVSPDDLSTLRTRFRLEELQHIQTEFVSFLNPSNHKVPGLIGYHSDYIYAVLIQSTDQDALSTWMNSVRSTAVPSGAATGQSLTIHFVAGCVKVNGSFQNVYQVVSKAKQALNEAVKSDEKDLVIYS